MSEPNPVVRSQVQDIPEMNLVVRSRKDIIDFLHSGGVVARHSILIILTALGGIFIDAYDFVSLGIGVQQLTKEFSLTPIMLGNLTASMAVGALLGAFVGGYYTDKIGRLKMFYTNLLFFVFSAIAAALAPNYEILMICRFIMGLGVGMDFPVAMAFIAEFSTSSGKTKWVGAWQGVWYIAAICSFIILVPFYYLGHIETLWRWSVGFGAVPALIVFVMRYFYMQESPLWAANNLGLKEAARILEASYKVKVTLDAPPEELVKPAPNYENLKFSRLFQGKYLVRTTMASVVAASQSLQYFAIGFYLPAISAGLFGVDPIYAIMGSIFFNCFGVVGGLSSGIAQTKIGTKPVVQIGYVMCITALIAIGLTMHSLDKITASALIALFILGHTLGPGTGGMAIATLSFPTEIRGIGCGWAQTMVRVGSIIGLYFFPLMRAGYGIEKTFLYLSIVPIAALIVVSLLNWEPAGKDVESETFDVY